jgi:hypothetical protein
MQYKNSELKINQLISYLNDKKINLSPAFQRGHVWKKNVRAKLVRNIALGRPIPAVFLYKQASGSQYFYNILDGKQRLESLILFIAESHPNQKIKNWSDYFYGDTLRKQSSFKIDLHGKLVSFANMSDETVRDFLEYSIPTIEISLNDDSSVDEVISLFVDINQQGEAVKRFDIVKAMYKSDPLMKSVFDLLAEEQKRGQDVFYKRRNSVFSRVLKQLQVVQSAPTQNSQVDRMWERLLELVLFSRRGTHSSAVATVREFITPKEKDEKEPRLAKNEINKLRQIFSFIASMIGPLQGKRLLSEQTHSYTLVTAMYSEDLLNKHGKTALKEKISRFASILDGTEKPEKAIARDFEQYREASTKQTTHANRRNERGRLFIKMLDKL